MKKAMIFLSILAIAATAAFVAVADDDAVYSVNTVSVIKYTIPAQGELTCISLPINPMTAGEWVWGETDLAKNLANGSKVYFWTGTRWRTYTKDFEDGSWADAAYNYVLDPGEAFFVRGPDESLTPQEVAVVGELPVDATTDYSVTGDGNLDVRGITPYPVEGAFGNTSMSTNLPNGTKVSFWNGTRWRTYTKDFEDGSWSDQALDYPYSIGEGVFIRIPDGDTTDTITLDRPFDWED